MKKKMMMNQSRPQKGQMLSNLLSIAASIYIVAAIMIYYFKALDGVKLNYFYFFSFFLNISLFSWLLFAKIKNKWVGSAVLLCCVFFSGITITYLIDWIGCGKPKLNSVYESFFIGAIISLTYISLQWTKQIYYYMRKLWNGF